MQKNGGYALEHAYMTHPTASKVFYLLLQMAHLIAQLIEKGSLFRQAFPAIVHPFAILHCWEFFVTS